MSNAKSLALENIEPARMPFASIRGNSTSSGASGRKTSNVVAFARRFLEHARTVDLRAQGMNLDDKIANFLRGTSAAPARSKLEPCAGLIRELRQRRWTYIRIAETLRTEFGVAVAPSTVFAFMKVRARRKEPAALPAPGIPTPVSAVPATRKPRFNLDA